MPLKTKIIGVIALVIMATVGFSTALVLNFQSNVLIKNNLVSLKLMSRVIIRSIEQDMVRGELGGIQKTLENMGKNPEIVNLRIVSPDGYILSSKNPSEVGYKSQDFVTSGEGAGRPAVVDNSMLLYSPIYNEPRCYGCHSSSAKVNGLVEIKSDFTRTKENILAMRRFLVLANIVTVIIVSLLLSLLVSKNFAGPVKNLLDAMKKVEDGDMEARAEFGGDGEFAALAESFNRVVERIKELHEKNLNKERKINRARTELDHKRTLEELNSRLEFKVKEVETANHAILSLSRELKTKNLELETMVERLKKISDLGRALSHAVEVQELLIFIIRTAAELLKAEKGCIYLEKNGVQKLLFRYGKGMGVEKSVNIMDLERPDFRKLLEGSNVFSRSGSNGTGVSAIGVPFMIKGKPTGGILLEKTGGAFSEDELEVLATLSGQAMVAIENAWLYESVKANYFGTIQVLINVIEANDRYTRGHSERVKTLAVMIGRKLGLSGAELELLEYAAILHDIGKIGVDSMIVNKNGRLTRAEFSLVKAHPLIGNEILGPIGTLDGIRTTILQHHERYDGTGYPYGMAGDEITLKARILSVADTFDSMMTDRPYRKAFSLQRVAGELRECAGKQFDPLVVNAFLDMLDSSEEEILARTGYVANHASQAV